MIYVISTGSIEYTTERVMEWLDNLGADYIRLNGENFTQKDNLYISIGNNEKPEFTVNSMRIIKNSVIWFRRWGHKTLFSKVSENDNDFQTMETLSKVSNWDNNTIKSFFINQLEAKHWLTDPYLSSMNKLKVLALASEFTLDIPPTIICSKKNDLQSFIDIHNEIIIKAISETVGIADKDSNHTFLTSKLDMNGLSSIPDFFVPTCFQKLIEKEFEIRTFYLDGKFYSMAIFSQKDEKTQLDFRNYNTRKPNRNVPFSLPKSIEVKLSALLTEIGLNCASIDLIRTTGGKFVFLEINPVGQFGMVSTPCNYQLEKKVAEHLINKDNEKNQ